MSVRIIGGDWKGQTRAPADKSTRPLLDRIKQSLFDTLGQRCDDWRVADACAGSGSWGFEAASRGAHESHMIEMAGPATVAYKQTIELWEPGKLFAAQGSLSMFYLL